MRIIWDSSQEQPCISGFLFKFVSDLKYAASVLFLASVELLCPYPWQMEGEQSGKKYLWSGVCVCVSVCSTSDVKNSF